MDRFTNKRVFITGGGSGIGRATVLRLLREGATAVAVDVDESGLQRTGELAGGEGTVERLRTRVLDVADEEAVTGVVRSAVAGLGGLDVLVNAAGILRAAHTHECSLQLWNHVLNTNLTGTFLVTRAALPALLESGRGVVVNFGSPPSPLSWCLRSSAAGWRAPSPRQRSWPRLLPRRHGDTPARVVALETAPSPFPWPRPAPWNRGPPGSILAHDEARRTAFSLWVVGVVAVLAVTAVVVACRPRWCRRWTARPQAEVRIA